jgi:hypothetical protein
MPRASTPRSARVTDGYDSDSDDDDVNEVGTFPILHLQPQCLITLLPTFAGTDCKSSIIAHSSALCHDVLLPCTP